MLANLHYVKDLGVRSRERSNAGIRRDSRR